MFLLFSVDKEEFAFLVGFAKLREVELILGLIIMVEIAFDDDNIFRNFFLSLLEILTRRF